MVERTKAVHRPLRLHRLIGGEYGPQSCELGHRPGEVAHRPANTCCAATLERPVKDRRDGVKVLDRHVADLWRVHQVTIHGAAGGTHQRGGQSSSLLGSHGPG